MTVLAEVQLDGVNLADYDTFNTIVNPEKALPPGCLSHATMATETGIRIVDVFSSTQDFENWQKELLGRGAEGFFSKVQGAPRIIVTELYDWTVSEHRS